MTTIHQVLCLLACSILAAAGPAEAGQNFAPIAAQFQEIRNSGHAPPRSSTWYFTRDGNRVEMGSGSYVELWERDQRGEVSWRRIFHDDRKLIDYTPGELRTQNRARPWETLNTVFDAPQLDSLRAVGKMTYLDRAATRYVGKVGTEEIEVVWLDAEQLPARIQRGDRWHIYYSLVLRELRPLPAGDWPRSDLARAQSYEYIDGADLGDREYDPFVRKVLAMDGHTHGHPH